MFKSETDFTKWFCESIALCNASVIVLAGGSVHQTIGLPDRLVTHKLFPTGCAFLEFKIEKRHATTQQALIIRDDFLAKGVFACVIRGRKNSDDICFEVFGASVKEIIVLHRVSAPVDLAISPVVGVYLIKEICKAMCIAHKMGVLK